MSYKPLIYPQAGESLRPLSIARTVRRAGAGPRRKPYSLAVGMVDARVVLADDATGTLVKSLDQFLRGGLALPSAAESDPSREDADVLSLRTAHGINRDEFKFGVAEAGNDFCLGKVVNPTCRKPRGGNP